MATISTVMANLLCDTLTAAVDVGGGGSLNFAASTDTVIASLDFGTTAFGTASGGVCAMTAAEISDTSAATTMTVDHAVIIAVGTTEIFSDLTCAVGSGDINMTSLSISQGDTVTLTTLTVTMPLS